jgi:hypothetical protein
VRIGRRHPKTGCNSREVVCQSFWAISSLNTVVFEQQIWYTKNALANIAEDFGPGDAKKMWAGINDHDQEPSRVQVLTVTSNRDVEIMPSVEAMAGGKTCG